MSVMRTVSLIIVIIFEYFLYLSFHIKISCKNEFRHVQQSWTHILLDQYLHLEKQCSTATMRSTNISPKLGKNLSGMNHSARQRYHTFAPYPLGGKAARRRYHTYAPYPLGGKAVVLTSVSGGRELCVSTYTLKNLVGCKSSSNLRSSQQITREEGECFIIRKLVQFLDIVVCNRATI